MNPYEVLQDREGARPDEVRAAYLRLAAQWNPENFPAEQRLQVALRRRELAEALTMLQYQERGSGLPPAPATPAPPTPPAPPASAAPMVPTLDDFDLPEPGSVQAIELESSMPHDPILDSGPQDPLSKAKRLFEAGRLEAAAEQAQAAADAEPDKPAPYLLLAQILEAKGGDHRALVAALERCLALDKRDVESAIKLAQTYQAHGMHTRATRYWEMAYNINPNHPYFQKPAEKASVKEKALETAADLKGSVQGLLEGAKGMFKFGGKG